MLISPIVAAVVAPVHSLRAILILSTARTNYVCRVPPVRSFRHIEFSCLAFAQALYHLLRAVSRDGCLVDKDILSGIAAVDKLVSIFYVVPLNDRSVAPQTKRPRHGAKIYFRTNSPLSAWNLALSSSTLAANCFTVSRLLDKVD